jgi:hypothetical protein
MKMADNSYQSKVYEKQGGDTLVVGPGGTLQLEGAVSGLSAGGRFFVSSVTGLSGNDGLSFSSPKATLAQAIALCTANKGDVIYLMPGHAESLSGAAALNINVAGVSIVGLGNGSLRPTFTWHTTDAVVTISANNVLVQNIFTAVDIDEVVSMFLVTGTNCTLERVDFGALGTSAQAIQWLLTTAAADFLTIKNSLHRQLTAAGSAQKWIQLVGTFLTRIVDNTFQIVANASTSSQLIAGTTAVVYCEISRNNILWIGATITTVVNLVTTSTGIICDNRCGSGTSVATAAAFTGDACFMFNNLWADTAAASGLLAPVVDTDT